MNERFGAVDGIQNPAEAAGADFIGKFFTQDRIVRK